MNIFLIIVGIILLPVCGFGYIVTHTAIKNQANWDDFYNFYKEVEKENLPVSEEMLYKLACKINLWFSIGFILGMLLLAGGIILQIIFK